MWRLLRQSTGTSIILLDSLAMEGVPSRSGRKLQVVFGTPMPGRDFAQFIPQSALMIGSKIQTIKVDCTNGRVVHYPMAGT
ncbi:MAG: hypothetical protein ACN4GZ_18010 [Acidimicrobiales bacterium]